MARQYWSDTSLNSNQIRTPDGTAGSPSEFSQSLRADRVAMLYRMLPLALLSSLVLAIIAATVLWNVTPRAALATWCLSLASSLLRRYLLCLAYRRNELPVDAAPLWERRFISGAALTGMAWGSGGLLFLGLNAISHELFYAFVLGGLTSGGLASLSPSRSAYRFFLVLTVAPFAARMAVRGDWLHVAMALMLLVYIASMLVLSRAVAGNLEESLTLRYAYLDLLADLARAKETTERANRAKSEFLSSMSHELRTPLNPILGFAQILEADGEEALRPDQRESAGHILSAGWHLLTLINEVLDLGKIEAGEMVVRIAPVALNDVARHCLTLIEPLAKKRHIRITSALCPAGQDWAAADAKRVKQVLINLLSNAVKYNRDNGLVGIVVSRGDGRVRVAVSDTGPGLNAEQLAGLFQAFHRVPGYATDVEGAG